jgi:hypothetical protein
MGLEDTAKNCKFTHGFNLYIRGLKSVPSTRADEYFRTGEPQKNSLVCDTF